LHYALLTEKQDLILKLLTAGADIHASDRMGKTPYTQALKAGKTNLASLMLIHSANPRAVDRDANSLLHLAALRGDVATMEELVRRGANVNARNGLELTPLHLAIEQQMTGAVKALLEAKAQVDFHGYAALGRAQDLERTFTSYPSLSPDTTDVSGRSYLHWAALGGQEEIMATLLKRAKDTNKTDRDGRSPLDYAARYGHTTVADMLLVAKARSSIVFAVTGNNPTMISRLLTAGADVNEKNGQGQTALHLAVEANQPDMVKLLLSKGADPVATDAKGRTPKDLAVRGRNERITALMLAASPKAPQLKPKSVPNLLHSAVASRNLKVIPELVKSGADLEGKDAEGRTPFLLAAESNFIEVMEELLKLGANLHARNNEGNTALHQAVRTGFDWDQPEPFAGGKEEPLWVKWGGRTGLYLLSKNADVNATNKLGQTAFHIVGLRGEVGTRPAPYVHSMVANLLSSKGDINRRDLNGKTPLHVAVQTGSYPLVYALVTHGADPNIKDKEGRTPLHETLVQNPAAQLAVPRTVLKTGNATQPMILTRINELSGPNLKVVEALMEAKADINATDNQNKTPLQMATERQLKGVLVIFHAKGGK